MKRTTIGHLTSNYSLRDIENITAADIRKQAKINYLLAIGYRANVSYYLIERIYESMFGDAWIKQPYNRLYSIAKMITAKRHEDNDYRLNLGDRLVRNTVINGRVTLSYDDIMQYVFMKHYKKIFGATASKNFYSDIMKQLNKNREQAVEEFRKRHKEAIDMYNIVKLYAPDALKDLKKVFSGANGISIDTERLLKDLINRDLQNTVYFDLLKDTISETIKATIAIDLARQHSANPTNTAAERLIMNSYKNCSYQLPNAKSEYKFVGKHLIARFIKPIQDIAESERLLKEIGMEYEDCYITPSHYKINPKTITLIKRVATMKKHGVSDNSLRQIIANSSRDIAYDSTPSRTIITPYINNIKTSK